MNQQLTLAPIQNCELSTTGAKITSELSYDGWMSIGRELMRITACTNWWLGDWGNYGVKKYGDRARRAVELAEQVGVGEERMVQAMKVSESVGTRVPTLSWTHHREVIGLGKEDQRKWLNKAKDNEWSVSQLRQAIRTSLAEYNDDEPNPRLFEWAKTADDLMRHLKRMTNEEPIESWSSERRQAVKEQLKPIGELYERL